MANSGCFNARGGDVGARRRVVGLVAQAVALAAFMRGVSGDVVTTGDSTAVFEKSTGNWEVQDPSAVTEYVGLNSLGILGITGVATLTTPVPLGENFPSLSIGSAAGVTGGVQVTGANASLIVRGLAEVGEFGTGTLLVTQGGRVSAVNLAAGGQTTGDGSVGVDGAGTTISVSDNFIIGNQGNGTLDVDDEGKVTMDFGVIGGNGMGNATVSNGSMFTANVSLIVAGRNSGYLSIESGSTLTAPVIDMGVVSSANDEILSPGGVMIIDGATLHCSTALEIAIGGFAFDAVSVRNGSTVTAGTIDVGAGGTGFFYVGGTYVGRRPDPDDSGLISTVTATTINVGGGQFDSGIHSGMVVMNGAQVTSDFTTIGSGPATVTGITEFGTRSTWNTGFFFDGSGDIGGFLVTDGGLATSTTATIDHGTAIVDGSSNGTASSWVISGVLAVGGAGELFGNTLEVTNGAALTSGDAFLGDATLATDVGATVIDGVGTQWTAGNIFVGNGFDHVLTISDGATVSSRDFVVGNGSHGVVVVTDEGTTLNTNGHLLVVGNAAGIGEMSIANEAQVASGDVYIGGFADATGNVTVSDFITAWTSGNITVGDLGEGTLTVLNGAAVTGSSLHIGANVETVNDVTSPGNGLVTVDGGTGVVAAFGGSEDLFTSSVTVSGNLFVGEWGVGEMDILNGGVVTSSTGFVGTNGGSKGALFVSGFGSLWQIENYLTIGTYGNGTATVEKGGMVTAGNILVGENDGGVGNLTVDGAMVTTPTSFEVGKGGNGTLTVTDAGIVTADSLGLGELQTGVGVVTFDGMGSNGTFTNGIMAGDLGIGNLGLSNLAKVSGATLVIGGGTGAVGGVSVSGFVAADPPESGVSQTTLAIAGDVRVGGEGAGTLTIRDGGLVTSANVTVGDLSGGVGMVSVMGNRSLWGMGGNLRIGVSGKGNVTVSEGGTITAASVDIGVMNNGSEADAPDGSLTLAVGTVTVSGALTVGDAGVGSLASNGTLSTTDVVFGNGTSGTGEGVMTGGTWTLGNMTIGEMGNGNVAVVNGSVSPKGITLGDLGSGVGILTVGEANGTGLDANGTAVSPLIIASGNLLVGNSGTGNVTVQSGDLTAASAMLGVNAGSNGTVTVAGGSLQLTGRLTVGTAGTGDLEMNGGRVVASSLVVGGGTGDGDKVNMQGTSVLTVFGTMTIGASGANGTFTETGGDVSAGTTSVGTASLSAVGIGVGTLTVGPGSFHGGKLTVVSGSTVMIQQGGKIDGTSATIGSGHFLSAQVTITGPTSALDVGNGTVSVGGFGAADLEVDAGAEVDCKTLTVDVAGELQGDGGIIHGNVVNKGGTVHPGDSPGTLTIAGDFAQTDGVMDVEFTGAGAGEMDLLDVLGNATVSGGVIRFSFLGGYLPKAGDVLPFLSAGSVPDVSGVTFEVIGVPGSFEYSVVTLGNEVELVALNDASAVPEPGMGVAMAVGMMGLLVKRRRGLR